MNFDKQDREWSVTPEPFAALRGNSAKGLSRWAQRCFAALSMTRPVLVVTIHYQGAMPSPGGLKSAGMRGYLMVILYTETLF